MSIDKSPAPGLGVISGTVMLLGAVLGPGALALPALAAAAAGPASVVAWVLLLAASVPVALTFAALGGAYPDQGGVAQFVAVALGSRFAGAVGCWFLAAVPIGVTAAALMGGHYVAAALGAESAATWVGLGLLAVSFVLNAAGLHATARVQVGTAAVLVGLLVVTVVASVRHVHETAFTPFAPHGWSGVAAATTVLFFAFAGWETAAQLSADFADPVRGLRHATVATLAVVTVLYLGLAFVTLGVLGPVAGTTPVPLLALLHRAFGGTGTALSAAAAVLLTLGAINAYLASGARLGAALGRDGALPPWLVGAAAPGREPRRSLAFLAACCCLLAVPVAGGVVGLAMLLSVTSVLLVAVTLAGTAAGARLLRGHQRWRAVCAMALVCVVLLCSGSRVLVPAGVGAATLVARPRRGAAPAPAMPAPRADLTAAQGDLAVVTRAPTDGEQQSTATDLLGGSTQGRRTAT